MNSPAQPIVTQLEELVREVPGWTPIDQLHALWNIAFLTTGLQGDILEIGSWCGRSSLVLAHAARLAGSKVHCIDLFPAKDDWKANEAGDYYFTVDLGHDCVTAYTSASVWPEPFQRDIVPIYERYAGTWEAFHANIAHAGMTDCVIPFRGNAAMFLQSHPNFACRVAFIDGDHGYEEVLSDIRSVERHLVPGGWICFDDAFTTYKGVDQAIVEGVINNPDFELGLQLTRKFFVARKKLPSA